ncbi:hypothetical protein [Pseudonocardia sp. T1-2H]|uniref:hypothetical protein n=1 Tax=Pseudonocardia sp. T1-2H TaxID=3128899 RepID=UPI003101554E
MKVNSGHDAQARMMGGNGAGFTGSATSPTATGFTASGLTASAYIGQQVILGSVYGVITANTTTTVTVDRWYTPANPGGAAASTPGAGTFVIVPGNAPLAFMALTANATAPAATDTALAAEITTAGGGLVRQLGVYAHTTGVAGYTLTGTYTANGSDALPVIVAKVGVFNSMVPGAGGLGFETSLSSTATFAASGDQLTLTSSVSN